MYDPQFDNFQFLYDLTLRNAGTSVGINNLFIFMAGRNNNHGVTNIDIYDVEKRILYTSCQLPDKRIHPMSAVVNDKIYVFGGSHFNDLSNMISSVLEGTLIY